MLVRNKSAVDLHAFAEAVQSDDPVAGYTHDFYSYPARFSPLFANQAIKLFTEPGDLVVDPFMGGATTLVEARTLGRRCVGADINELSLFLAQVKTKIVFRRDLDDILAWAKDIGPKLNLHNPLIRPQEWIDRGYQRNINSRRTWPTRKTIELVLTHLHELKNVSQRRFARCALLKTAQWALDCTKIIPSAKDFRQRVIDNIIQMTVGAVEFSAAAKASDRLYSGQGSFRTVCLKRSAVGLEQEAVFEKSSPPKLILTSPPYPGVHVLYHRWQINGRKETPAPFWIANSVDGHGESYYTFGSRKQKTCDQYFDYLFEAYKSLAKIAGKKTIMVQLVGFSKAASQLPRYLETISQAGFIEHKFPSIANMPDGRLWRVVPNRKWYARHKGSVDSSKEVVLFHLFKH